jgi:hypothetical protein
MPIKPTLVVLINVDGQEKLFWVLGVLGEGSFALTLCVKDCSDGKEYAVKGKFMNCSIL